MPQSLLDRKGICNEQTALERINAYLARHNLNPVTRSTWKQSIRPVLEAEGDVQWQGNTWIVDADQLWRWQEYIAKRQILIDQARPGWHTKRPYSSADAYALVDDGALDGEVDHPLFEIALNLDN